MSPPPALNGDNHLSPTLTLEQGAPSLGQNRSFGGTGRWKIWELCKNDPEFPKPRTPACLAHDLNAAGSVVRTEPGYERMEGSGGSR